MSQEGVRLFYREYGAVVYIKHVSKRTPPLALTHLVLLGGWQNPEVDFKGLPTGLDPTGCEHSLISGSV